MWSSWSEQFGTLSSDVLVDLEKLADTPEDLLWLDDLVPRLRFLCDTRRIKPAQLQSLKAWFNNWDRGVWREVLHLNKDDFEKLQKTFDLPSDVDLDTTDEWLKPATRKRVEENLEKMFSEEEDVEAESTIEFRDMPASAPTFENMLVSCDAGGIISPKGTVINKKYFAMVDSKRCQTVEQLVDQHRFAQIKALGLCGGALSNMEEIADATKNLSELALIDLSLNSFRASELNSSLTALLKRVAKNDGAVVVCGNSLASLEAQEELTNLALGYPELFLRLIWIYPGHLHRSTAWKFCLEEAAKPLCNLIFQAHCNFFAQSPRLASVLSSTSFLGCRP